MGRRRGGPKPWEADNLDPGQYPELNALFYTADPSGFIKMRIESLSLMACSDDLLNVTARFTRTAGGPTCRSRRVGASAVSGDLLWRVMGDGRLPRTSQVRHPEPGLSDRLFQNQPKKRHHLMRQTAAEGDRAANTASTSPGIVRESVASPTTESLRRTEAVPNGDLEYFAGTHVPIDRKGGHSVAPGQC
jgi:hypothetical protein